MRILTPSLTNGADSNFEFGTRFIPTKLVEDKEGMIHIFAKKGTSLVPEKIPGLTVTSLESKIIRVLTVKVVPDTFSSDGPFRGLVSVELADADGFPVKAAEDVSVSLSVANNNILDISQENLVIKKGEYFTGTHFIVKDSGNVGTTNIFATALAMEAKSNTITVDEQVEDLQVKLYLLQEEINVFGKAAKAHIIVQLQLKDSEEPVIASKDITVKYKVTNDIFANQNTSPDANIGDKTSSFL